MHKYITYAQDACIPIGILLTSDIYRVNMYIQIIAACKYSRLHMGADYLGMT